jgi:hypothetical protein
VAPQGSRAEALAWATAEFDGVVRALEPVPSTADAGPGGYRIARYLDQHGRRTRRDMLGPASLWDALTAHAHAGAGPSDLTRLGQAARPEDVGHAARWAVGRVRLHDPWDLARLLDELRAGGARDAIQALLDRDPASWVGIDRQWDAIDLLGALHRAGAAGAVDVLAARVVEHASLEDLPSVASLLRVLHAVGAVVAIRALVTRDPARHADPEEPDDSPCCLRRCTRPAPQKRSWRWPAGPLMTPTSSARRSSPG